MAGRTNEARPVDGKGRVIDAYCGKCEDVRKHEVQDVGSCKCVVCGTVQQLMAPFRERPVT